MSKAPSKNEAVKGFVPSTGDESYIEGGAKPLVTNKEPLAKNAQLERALPVMADEINGLFEQGLLQFRSSQETMMEVGRKLNIARNQFSSNTKFGTWRKKMIRFSGSHVQRLMSVAKEFGEEPDAILLPIGTLAVMTNVSKDLKQKVIAAAKEGKAPTRAEVTADKKAEQGKESPPESADDATEQMESEPGTKPDLVIEEPNQLEDWEEAQVMLDKPLTTRLATLSIEGSSNPFINSCILYGIPPYHDGQPSLDLVSNLYFAYSDKVEKADPKNTDALDKLTEAHDILTSVIKLNT